MRAAYCRYILRFREPATTSRATMLEKETYFIKLWEESDPERFGIGECALFRGLSHDDRPDYQQLLEDFCRKLSRGEEPSSECSSILFGYDTALADLLRGGTREIFPTGWVQGKESIPINGLIWMGTAREMLSRVQEKIDRGFRCLKLKIGGIDFDQELRIIKDIRQRFAKEELELRLDANGAFTPENALERLETLSSYSIHSIEQPIRQGQYPQMARICRESPIPIALDEELIGIRTLEEKRSLIECLRPSYVILKPALCGGLAQAREWIDLARETSTGWWITSALESNVGLNALAQLSSASGVEMPQGLGTGGLYLNNIPSPIAQEGSGLRYDPNKNWDFSSLQWRI